VSLDVHTKSGFARKLSGADQLERAVLSAQRSEVE
jgi:hypothetical protein